MIILGSLQRDNNYWPINFIILATKSYIFWCAKNNYALNIYFLQKELTRIFNEQKLLAKLNLIETKFMRSWQLWVEIFNLE